VFFIKVVNDPSIVGMASSEEEARAEIEQLLLEDYDKGKVTINSEGHPIVNRKVYEDVTFKNKFNDVYGKTRYRYFSEKNKQFYYFEEKDDPKAQTHEFGSKIILDTQNVQSEYKTQTNLIDNNNVFKILSSHEKYLDSSKYTIEHTGPNYEVYIKTDKGKGDKVLGTEFTRNSIQVEQGTVKGADKNTYPQTVTVNNVRHATYSSSGDTITYQKYKDGKEVLRQENKYDKTGTLLSTDIYENDPQDGFDFWIKRTLENGIKPGKEYASHDVDLDKEFNGIQKLQLKKRQEEFNDALDDLKEYGVEKSPEIVENDRGTTVKYDIQGMQIEIAGQLDEKGRPQRTETVTIKGETYTYRPGKWPWDDDVFVSQDGKSSYVIRENCKGGLPHCWQSGNRDPISISEQQYNALDDIEKFSNKANDLMRAKTGRHMKDMEQRWNKYGDKLDDIMNSQLSQLMTAIIDNALGEYFNAIPNGICNMFTGTDYSVEKVDSNSEQKILGFTIPRSNFQTDKEREIHEDTRTVVAFGHVVKLSDGIFRYELTLKLIGDANTNKWEMYLFNSCTNKNSKEFFGDTGSFIGRNIFIKHYAGDTEQDTVFDCSTDPQCAFNEACVKIDDEANPRCFKLAGGSGVCTG